MYLVDYNITNTIHVLLSEKYLHNLLSNTKFLN